jgi:hypothetical protein
MKMEQPDGQTVEVEMHDLTAIETLLHRQMSYRAGKTDAAYPTRANFVQDVIRMVRAKMEALVRDGLSYIQLDEGFVLPLAHVVWPPTPRLRSPATTSSETTSRWRCTFAVEAASATCTAWRATTCWPHIDYDNQWRKARTHARDRRQGMALTVKGHQEASARWLTRDGLFRSLRQRQIG